jgi:hypothetical protein
MKKALIKYSFFLVIGLFLLTGCTHEHLMLSELRESDWYKSQTSWAEGRNNDDSDISSGYIFGGQIKEIRYNYYKKTISDVVLSPAHCLYSSSYWDEWFSPDPISFGVNNDDFKDGYFPTVGEYWAFGVSKGLKDRYKVESAVKLFYNTNYSKVERE